MADPALPLTDASQLVRSPRARAGYGPFARWLLGWLFKPVAFPPEAVTPLLELSQKATLVYVLRSSSLLHLLYFNWRLFNLGLPIARAAIGLGYRIFAPFARWYLGGPQIKARRDGQDGPTAQVTAAVRQGESAMVFLRSPRTLPSQLAQLADPFPALVALQRELGPSRSIALVPLTLLWRRRPRKLSRGWRDVLFGDPEEPGAIRATIGFLIHRGGAFVKAGTPVLLADELQRQVQPEEEPALAGVPAASGAALSLPSAPRAEGKAAADTARVARRVRGFLHQHLARETRVVTGPPLKSVSRVAEETLRDLTLRRALDEIARERGRADDSVFREARKCVREIAARYNGFAVDVIRKVLWVVFNRVYDGIDVDEAGMRRVIEASAKGPIVLCPCHKSHIDYLIMSLVCDEHGMQPPHVAAGDNLNFWPVGRLLRMGGAFFIRRSFKNDRVYSATLSAYVKRLLRDGFTQEFFVEGGRSRTGKLLPPKFGMLSMEVEAWLTGVKSDVWFVPVSISYEKIAEGASYQRELLGGEKQKEDAKALLSATKVLRARLGRITIRFDAPLSLAALFAERGVDPHAHDADARRKLVAALGWKVAAGINRAAPLAPMGLTCAALLSHDLRALSHDEVFARADFLYRAALDTLGPRGTGASLKGSGLVERALASLTADGSARRLAAGGEAFYSVVEERRMALDYHKNSIIHFLVNPAILASALRSFHGEPAPVPELLRRAKELSRLFKSEFIYEPGKSFEETVGDTFLLMLHWGLAETRGEDESEELLPIFAGARNLMLLSELLRPFGEGVWLAVTSLELLRAAPMEPAAWARAALERGRAAYLAGRIRRAESLSKATLDNALAMLKDRGVVEQGEGKNGKLSLSAAFVPAEKLASLAAEVDLYLR